MSEIATLQNGTLHFESEWLEKLNIGADDQVEVNIFDDVLVVRPAQRKEYRISEDLINRIREQRRRMAMISDSAQREKSERKKMTIEEFDKFLEGKDLNELLHQARRRSEEWHCAEDITVFTK